MAIQILKAMSAAKVIAVDVVDDAVGIDREIGETHLPSAFQKTRRRSSVVVWIWEFHDHDDPRIGKDHRAEIAVGQTAIGAAFFVLGQIPEFFPAP